MAIPVTGLFNILAGFIFGMLPTVIMVVLSRTSASFVLFKFGRNTRYRNYIRRAKWWPKFKQRWREYAILYLLMLRIFPIIPSWSVSVAAGLLRLPSRIFLAVTIIGKMPGTILYAWIGHHSNNWFNPHHPLKHTSIWQTRAVWIPIVIMLTCTLGPGLLNLGKRQYQRLKATD